MHFKNLPENVFVLEKNEFFLSALLSGAWLAIDESDGGWSKPGDMKLSKSPWRTVQQFHQNEQIEQLCLNEEKTKFQRLYQHLEVSFQ